MNYQRIAEIEYLAAERFVVEQRIHPAVARQPVELDHFFVVMSNDWLAVAAEKVVAIPVVVQQDVVSAE